MNIELNCNINIDINEPTLKNIVSESQGAIREIVTQLFNHILLTFAETYLLQNKMHCDLCGHNEFTWKTRIGKKTGLLTIFGELFLNQLQIRCKRCNHKMYIVRKLLQIKPRVKIPFETIRKLGLIGALTTFRVASKIVGMFGWKLDKMNIWRSVQKLAKTIDFNLDPNEKAEGEADGTGIPTIGIKKRGKELKVFAQRKIKGGIKIAGLAIGNYDGGWNKLFDPLLDTMNLFKNFLLVTDGDTNIFKSIKTKVDVLFQRCLWHIPHQFKYFLWKDGVGRKEKRWKELLSSLIGICIAHKVVDDEADISVIVNKKKEELENIIHICEKDGLKHCASYLRNAKPDMFTALENKLSGRTTSLTERVMRIVNMRIKVGKWSQDGALNVNKVRLAYYYNDFDVS